MTRNALPLIRMWAAIALSTTALGTAVVLAQTPAPDPHHDIVAEHTRPAAAKMNGQNMMADQQAMMATMAAEDRKLTDLVVKMNMAAGDAKVEAIAAVVTELAAQRSRMREMMRMQGDMMGQMMSRMSAMHGSGGMMKRAPEAPKESTDDHAAHHPEK